MNGTSPKDTTYPRSGGNAASANGGTSADDLPPAFGLSEEDIAIAARWRAEVGDDRLHRIVAALAAGRPGRKSEEQDRRPLLLMMARLSLTHPNAKPYRLACMVVASPEGEAERSRCMTTDRSLNRWLCTAWGKQGTKLRREVATVDHRQVASDLHAMARKAAQLFRTPVPPWIQTAQDQIRTTMESTAFIQAKEIVALTDSVRARLPVVQPFSSEIQKAVDAILRVREAIVSPSIHAKLAFTAPAVVNAIFKPSDAATDAARALLPLKLEKTPAE